jgi:hypothetical protein
MKKIRTQKLKATFKFDKKIAMKFHDTRYYNVGFNNYKYYLERQALKKKISTPRTEFVSKILLEYRRKRFNNIKNINNFK